MSTQKPLQLIGLLEQLLAETEKINIGKIYIAIVEETNRFTFDSSNPFTESVYKNLIRLSIKDYIHSGHSLDSIRIIREVIDVISDATISRK